MTLRLDEEFNIHCWLVAATHLFPTSDYWVRINVKTNLKLGLGFGVVGTVGFTSKNESDVVPTIYLIIDSVQSKVQTRGT